MIRCSLASDLDAQVRRMLMQTGNQYGFDHIVKCLILLRNRRQALRKRRNQPVSQEHAQKRSDQRATDHLAQNLGRLIDRAHGLDHPQNSGHDSQRRQGIRHVLQGVGGVHRLFVHQADPLRQHFLDLIGIVIVQAGRAQGIGNKRDRLLIRQNLGIGLENRRGGRILDMFLEFDGACTRDAQQLKQQAQHVLKVGFMPARPLE